MARINETVNGKTAIYAAHGIEYKAGKINAPVFGWIAPLLVNGNDKLGKGVWTFSTLPANIDYTLDIDGTEYTARGTCPCNCSGCYAQRGNYNFYSCKKSNLIKTYLSREYLDFVTRAVIAQIKADKITICRIHASGNFFSADYIQAWKRIAAESENTVFWSYTKNPDAEKAFNGLSNVNIVRSVVPGHGFNFGHVDYILRVYKALRDAGKPVYICRCGIDKDQHCTNCHGCTKNEYVLFVEHSTGYQAEKDPMFPALVEIINNQPSMIGGETT